MHIEIKGMDRQFKRLDAIDKGLADTKPFLKEAGAILIDSSQKHFKAGGRPKWASLSPVTVLLRARSREGYREHKRGSNRGRTTKGAFDTLIAGMKTLRDRGILMASIGSTAGGGIYVLKEGSVTVGTALKYAAAQQEGATTGGYIPGKKIPARPFLGPTPGEKQQVYDAAVRFVNKTLKEHS